MSEKERRSVTSQGSQDSHAPQSDDVDKITKKVIQEPIYQDDDLLNQWESDQNQNKNVVDLGKSNVFQTQTQQVEKQSLLDQVSEHVSEVDFSFRRDSKQDIDELSKSMQQAQQKEDDSNYYSAQVKKIDSQIEFSFQDQKDKRLSMSGQDLTDITQQQADETDYNNILNQESQLNSSKEDENKNLDFKRDSLGNTQIQTLQQELNYQSGQAQWNQTDESSYQINEAETNQLNLSKQVATEEKQELLDANSLSNSYTWAKINESSQQINQDEAIDDLDTEQLNEPLEEFKIDAKQFKEELEEENLLKQEQLLNQEVSKEFEENDQEKNQNSNSQVVGGQDSQSQQINEKNEIIDLNEVQREESSMEQENEAEVDKQEFESKKKIEIVHQNQAQEDVEQINQEKVLDKEEEGIEKEISQKVQQLIKFVQGNESDQEINENIEEKVQEKVDFQEILIEQNEPENHQKDQQIPKELLNQGEQKSEEQKDSQVTEPQEKQINIHQTEVSNNLNDPINTQHKKEESADFELIQQNFYDASKSLDQQESEKVSAISVIGSDENQKENFEQEETQPTQNMLMRRADSEFNDEYYQDISRTNPLMDSKAIKTYQELESTKRDLDNEASPQSPVKQLPQILTQSVLHQQSESYQPQKGDVRQDLLQALPDEETVSQVMNSFEPRRLDGSSKSDYFDSSQIQQSESQNVSYNLQSSSQNNSSAGVHLTSLIYSQTTNNQSFNPQFQESQMSGATDTQDSSIFESRFLELQPQNPNTLTQCMTNESILVLTPKQEPLIDVMDRIQEEDSKLESSQFREDVSKQGDSPQKSNKVDSEESKTQNMERTRDLESLIQDLQNKLKAQTDQYEMALFEKNLKIEMVANETKHQFHQQIDELVTAHDQQAEQVHKLVQDKLQNQVTMGVQKSTIDKQEKEIDYLKAETIELKIQNEQLSIQFEELKSQFLEQQQLYDTQESNFKTQMEQSDQLFKDQQLELQSSYDQHKLELQSSALQQSDLIEQKKLSQEIGNKLEQFEVQKNELEQLNVNLQSLVDVHAIELNRKLIDQQIIDQESQRNHSQQIQEKEQTISQLMVDIEELLDIRSKNETIVKVLEQQMIDQEHDFSDRISFKGDEILALKRKAELQMIEKTHLNDEMDIIKSQRDKLQHQIMNLQGETLSSQIERKVTENELTNMQQNLIEKILSSNESLVVAENQIQQLNLQIVSLQQKEQTQQLQQQDMLDMLTKNQEISQLEEKKHSQQNDVMRTLHITISQLTQQLQENQQEILQLNGDITQQNSDMKKLEQSYETLNLEVLQQSQEIQSSNNKSDEQTQTNIDLESKLSSQEALVKDLQTQIKSYEESNNKFDQQTQINIDLESKLLIQDALVKDLNTQIKEYEESKNKLDEQTQINLDLESKLLNQEALLKDLNTQIEEYQGQILHFKEQDDSQKQIYENQLNNSKEVGSQQQLTIDDLNLQIQSLEGKHDEISSIIQQLSSEILELQNQKLQHIQHIEVGQQNTLEKDTKIQDLQAQLKDQDSVMMQDTIELNKRIKQLQNEMQEQVAIVSHQQEQLGLVSLEVHKLNEINSQLESQQSTLKLGAETREKELLVMQELKEQWETERNTLKENEKLSSQQINLKVEQIGDLNKMVEDNQTQIQQLQKMLEEVDDTESIIIQLQREIVNLQSQGRSNDEDQQDLQNQTQQLVKELQEKQQNNKSLQDQVDMLHQTTQEQTKIINNHEQSRQQWEQQINMLQSDLKETKTQLQQSNQQQSHLQKQFERVNEEQSQLNIEKRETIHRLEQQVTQLVSQVQDIETKRNGLQRELQLAEQQAEDVRINLQIHQRNLADTIKERDTLQTQLNIVSEQQNNNTAHEQLQKELAQLKNEMQSQITQQKQQGDSYQQQLQFMKITIKNKEDQCQLLNDQLMTQDLQFRKEQNENEQQKSQSFKDKQQLLQENTKQNLFVEGLQDQLHQINQNLNEQIRARDQIKLQMDKKLYDLENDKNSQIMQLSSQKVKLQSIVKENQIEYERRFEEVVARCNASIDESEQKELHIISLQNQIQEIQDKQQDQDQLNEYLAQLQYMTNQVEQLSQQLVSVKSELKTKETSEKTIQGLAQQMKRDYDSLIEENQRLANQMQKQGGQIQNFKQIIEDLESKLSRLTQELQRVNDIKPEQFKQTTTDEQTSSPIKYEVMEFKNLINEPERQRRTNYSVDRNPKRPYQDLSVSGAGSRVNPIKATTQKSQALDQLYMECLERSRSILERNMDLVTKTRDQNQSPTTEEPLNQQFDKALNSSFQTLQGYNQRVSAKLPDRKSVSRERGSATKNKIDSQLQKQHVRQLSLTPNLVTKVPFEHNTMAKLMTQAATPQIPKPHKMTLEGPPRIQQNYKGDYLNGMRHGRGKYLYENGDTYEGEWYKDQRYGYGTLKDKQGDVYLGYWQFDQMNGCGHLRNINVEQINKSIDFHNLDDIDEKWVSYQGEFQNGMFHGYGTLTLSNGERFHGSFLAGKAQGTGTFYRHNGEIIPGQWKNNIYIDKNIGRK